MKVICGKAKICRDYSIKCAECDRNRAIERSYFKQIEKPIEEDLKHVK